MDKDSSTGFWEGLSLWLTDGDDPDAVSGDDGNMDERDGE